MQSDDTHPKISGIALDMDGLLFDTEKLYWDVGDTVLQRRGFRFSHELQQKMMGRVGTQALQQMVDHHGLGETAESLLVESNELYGERILQGVDPMPGLEEWIEMLIQSEIPFGLATSSQRKFVDVIFKSISWRKNLAFMLTGDDVQNGKPHPEMYLTAAARLGVEPASMLVLEDSGNGCAAAVAAGTYAVAVPSEHTRGQNFSGAKLVAESLLDPRLHALLR
ncbi:HAD-IA family hydrolase [Rubripirellula amarantea]|uniref:Phosphorylated carbohydrates phosphatase n=1 Tax=Rubripirellula amarantea TaxID=2527999 RepID=A0A5C5WID6_9BACT|nr:HAD-IA family hydrolase [Rubripirellula amarantea]MDA8743684.1 HAD-IA family hydrolase [Rubripirellula amarantea]TWT49783.1 Phosphorylated carbohydrates phosphatase [Rubripirellula amarantea]